MLNGDMMNKKQVMVSVTMHETQDDAARLDLPPLHALQAFEAAARLGSLTRAAAERHLTPSAVSRAVTLVEHWRGTPLFQRHGPRLSLTLAGHALRERMAEPLQALHLALHEERRPRAGGPLRALTVLALPSFAQGWLLPRLPQFLQAHGDIALRLQLGYAVESLPALQPRVALRFGSFDKTGLHAERLWRDPLVAVAAPAWAERHGALPSRWPGAQLLRMSGAPWPRRLGAHPLAVAAGLEVNDALVLAEAARCGLGVAWLRRSLVAEALDQGALQDLTPPGLSLGETALWLVCRDEMREHPAVAAFWQWVSDAALRDSRRRPSA